ncbi:MAG: paraquat-inducible protein A [Rhodobacteraceae bacterium]|nr:paraquat-inducible protein A [Paracoccaceae bacterium]
MQAVPEKPTTEELIACPQCDALYRVPSVPDGARLRCSRCHALLLAPRAGAVEAIVSLASGALALMVASIAFPFLHLGVAGLSAEASVIDTIRSYAVVSGLMAPLSVLLAALIVVLPAMRLGGLIYALGPLVAGRDPPRFATPVFRLAMNLRPWAMTEVFMIGVAVALVKIAALATVSFGPSFWTFIAVVLLVGAKDTMVCEKSLWRVLTRP